MKKCPYCAEDIQDAAIKCRFCGSVLTGVLEVPPLIASPSITDVAPAAAEEKAYYTDGAITITSTRAVMGGKTYAMANITSVTLAEHREGVGCASWLVILGGLFTFALVDSDTVFIGIIGIVMLLIGILLLLNKSYAVRIGSASGEADALHHRDRQHIQQIVDAVTQAIIDRR